MAINSSTLRPGLLVGLSTEVKGGVSYVKQDIEAEHILKSGAKRAKWETEKTIDDPEEYERAQKARNKVRSLIGSACARSAFGYLCPEADVDRLEAAISEARKVADDFNASAKGCRVSVYVITGTIAPDDVKAVQAINSEVRELLDRMTEGLEQLDVDKVRDAASRARSVGQMLSPLAQERIQGAIEVARAEARKIVAAGETAALEIDAAAIRTVAEARTAFLDLDEQREIAAPTAEKRAIDFEPSPLGGDIVLAPSVAARSIEL
jgi:hypothetical protein